MACIIPADLLEVSLSPGSTTDAAFEDAGVFLFPHPRPAARERHYVRNLSGNDAMRRLTSQPGAGEDAFFRSVLYDDESLAAHGRKI